MVKPIFPVVKVMVLLCARGRSLSCTSIHCTRGFHGLLPTFQISKCCVTGSRILIVNISPSLSACLCSTYRPRPVGESFVDDRSVEGLQNWHTRTNKAGVDFEDTEQALVSCQSLAKPRGNNLTSAGMFWLPTTYDLRR